MPISVRLEPLSIVTRRRNEARAIGRIVEETGRPSSEFFFVGRPGDNRVFGQTGLVYDEWLYPVFESLHLADPRSNWLRHVLTTGPIRIVVNTTESPKIDGVGLTLPELGYASHIQVEPFFVWVRGRLTTVPTQSTAPIFPPNPPSSRSGIGSRHQ